MTAFIPFRRANYFEGGRYMYHSVERWRLDVAEWIAFHRKRRPPFPRKRPSRMAGK